MKISCWGGGGGGGGGYNWSSNSKTGSILTCLKHGFCDFLIMSKGRLWEPVVFAHASRHIPCP